MELNLIYLVFVFVAYIAVIFCLMRIVEGNHSWEYPPNKNPYRRTCRHCGLIEEYYQFNGAYRGHWEPMNSLKEWQWCNKKEHI